ncbi:MAG: hypothetical protein CXT67_09610, partial [Methanobacteriota archaeon]
MVGDDVESDDSNDLPLDDSVYISKEEDTMEKMKRGLKKFGKDMKKGAGDIADSSKKFATKSKEKYEAAREERKKAKAMKNPLKFPWSTLSVVELKENLKGLGLKVSGKKDDLIERITEHYRTEIPEMEDGTPHLIEDLEPVEETPAAPDIDELVKEEGEVVEELNPTFEEVDPETPAIQFEGSEQMYVYDPPENITIKKNYSYKAINYVNFLFGLSMFFITLCILNKGFDFGLDVGFIYDFIANRFVRSYGGMSDVQITSLSGALSLMLLFSSLMYFSGRQTAAALLVVVTVAVSVITRVIVAYATTFENDGLFYFIIDVVLAIPFCFSVWVPSIVRSSLEYDAYHSSFMVYSEPESITDGTSNEQLGDGMGRFEVDRPLPPKRRKIGQGTMYELLFLVISIVLWPISIGVSALLILNYPTSHGSWTMEEHSLILLPLYAGSFFCSLIVYRI